MALDSPVRRLEDDDAKIPLSGVRAEFRTALRAEIEAAEQRSARSTTVLEAGRRLGRIADAVQYVFAAPSAISVPSDSPGELLIEGLPPLKAVVVCVEGLEVTVSVSHEIGDCVPRAALRRDLLLAPRRLVDRIEEAGSEPNPAGDRLLGDVPASGTPTMVDDALLDNSHRVALRSSLGRDITLICGPPGMRKTQTIGSIGAHLYRQRRSVLLVSYTSGAVDQALEEIAQQLGAELEEGALLRLGTPSVQRVRAREDLLLDAVVWNQTAELREHEARLRAQKADTQRDIAESERMIKVAAWAPEARANLADFLFRITALHSTETAARRLAGEIARGAIGEAELLARLAEAQAAAGATAQVRRLRAELPRLTAELDAAREAVDSANAAVTQARWNLDKALELDPLVARERAMPPLAEQRHAVETLAAQEAKARKEAEAARVTVAQAVLTQATAASGKRIQRRFTGFRLRIGSRKVIAQRRAQLAGAKARLEDVSGHRRRAAAVLAELEQLDRQLAPWRKFHLAAKPEAQLRSREVEHSLAVATETRLEQRRADTLSKLAEAAYAVKHFRELRAAQPEGVVARLEPRQAELSRLRERQRETEHRAEASRKTLDADLSTSLVTIERLGLGHGACLNSAEERFVQVALAHAEARRLATEVDVASLHAGIAASRHELDAIDRAVVRVDEELGGTRQAVIAKARVIATTITRLYVGSELQGRRFDTVILDEAPMAPIPALWIAARLADANVVVLGDHKQPPPIRLSEHPLADKWLGQNIFDASRAPPAADHAIPLPHFIQLNELADRTPDAQHSV